MPLAIAVPVNLSGLYGETLLKSYKGRGLESNPSITPAVFTALGKIRSTQCFTHIGVTVNQTLYSLSSDRNVFITAQKIPDFFFLNIK